MRVGRGIALELGAAGYDVAVHYHRSEEAARRVSDELHGMGAEALLLQADLSQPEEIDGLFGRLREAWGALDLLVNSAAVFPRGRPEEVRPEEWDRVFALNARAPFFCAQRAAELMAGTEGCIVNVADVAAFEAWPSYVPYAATKAALVSLTRGLARAWAPGIRVNAVAPGPVLLPEGTTPEERERAAARTALGRVGSAEDVARAVVYLASAGYVTGEVLRVDGGAHLMKASGEER